MEGTVNIPLTLAAARKEWERQMEMERKGTKLYQNPSTWVERNQPHKDPDEVRSNVFALDGGYGIEVARFRGDSAEANAKLYILSRNLNPARLKVVKRLLDRAEKLSNRFRAHSETIEMTDQLVDALALLGIEAIA